MTVLSLKQTEMYAIGAALMTHQVQDINAIYLYLGICKKIIPELTNPHKKKSLKHLYNAFIRVHGIDLEKYTSKGAVL